MKLITEEVTNVKILTEGKGSNKKLYIEGVFLQGDLKNRNGRMYPMETLAKEVNRYNETFVNKGRALGELGHPDGPTVNLDRVSHKITSLVREGTNFRGKAQILNTPMGKIAEALLKGGAKLGVSSRGSGNVNESGRVSDFDIVTVDIVAQPSAPDAYPKAIYESLFNMKGGAVIHEMAEAVTHDKKAEIHLARMMESFIRELELK